MSENSNTQINEFILQAALDKSPLFDSFRKLCEKEENQEIEYIDFEWRYFQFYHGSRDLSIERSPENSSPLTFLDLPMILIQKVIKESALPGCLALRKVSRDLRNLVNSTDVHCERIGLDFLEDWSKIYFDDLVLTYEEMKDGCRCEIDDNREPGMTAKAEVLYTGGNINFPSIMLIDVSKIVNHPRLKIDTIRFEVRRRGAKRGFSECIRSLNFQVNARELNILSDGAHILPILEFMKPKVLEKITFYPYRMSAEQFNEIAETEQWKGAERLSWDGWYSSLIRVEKVLHFKEIEIKRFHFAESDLFMVRDLLLKSTHLETCHLPLKNPSWDYDEDFDLIIFDRDNVNEEESLIEEGEEVRQEDQQAEPMDKDEKEKRRVEKEVDRILSQDPAYSPYTRRYWIPNTGHYFQLEFEKDNVRGYILTIKRNLRR